MSEVQIFPMRIEDYDKIAHFWSKIFGNTISLEFDSRERISAYLKRNPEFSTVAKKGNDIIGTVLCGHDGRSGSLYHVAVSEEYRHKGIANEMVQQSLSLLKQEGFGHAMLFAYLENTTAIQYWKKNGWEALPDVLYHYKHL
ncbi:GNAT family N-acetyltransferase [Paenibacillus radicis (ex Xue et al. 2023)]|uniref:GNAT family N-acetyltransferase n=1 Tax=Paenibacillus radicis (ex Xue et al. 2023) TaxID=2972489 RepID=A0ABT1YBJ5_9BACL|nr:N-acetyltransferase [Paenibacillus radicis (ex Xue et al. 2023)]MCR8630562.1 GNAT family N-acetyltransferase [Paenibacillus radicis (ex Xue et al. 2023)]